MIYKTISGKEAIRRVLGEFNVVSQDWIARTPEWIMHCLADIGIYGLYKDCDEVCIISNYKFKLPCNIKVLKTITYNGERVDKAGTSNHDDHSGSSLSISPYTYTLLGNGYASLDVEEGEVKVFFKGLDTEFWKEYDIRLPRIPDNEHAIKAVAMYIFAKVLSRGYKHPIYSLGNRDPYYDPNKQFDHLRGIARVKISLPDLDERQRLHEIFTSMILSSHAVDHTFFDPTATAATSDSTYSSFSSELYNLTITVNLAGCTISINPDPAVTLGASTYSHSVVRSNGTYSYTVIKSGYTTQTGTINIQGGDVTKTITLI